MADKREGNYSAVKGWLHEMDKKVTVTYSAFIAHRLGGDVITAIILNHLLFWSDKGGRKDGMFFKSTLEITEETGLTRNRVNRGLKVLEERGILDKEVARAKGAPTNHFRINMDALRDLIIGDSDFSFSDNQESRIRKAEIHCTKSRNPLAEKQKSISRKPEIMNSRLHIREHSREQQYIHAHSSEIDKAQSEKHKNESLMNVSFDRFWDIYPRKVSKGQAMSTWKKLWKSMSIDQELVDEILEAVRKQKLRGGKLACEIKYIPYPSTWLNALSWEDESGAGRDIEGKDSDYDSGDLDRILALHKESRASR